MADDLRTTLNATRAAVSRWHERETGQPFGDPMTETEARKLTDRIKFDAGQLWDKLTDAYLGRADIALGYESWDTYCITEFGSLRLRLPREERAEMVCSLRQAGLSNRAIASATGYSEGTVRNDLAAQNYAPDEDELTEQLLAGEPEPLRFNVTSRTITHEPIRVTPRTVTREPARQLTVVTGLDGKTYRPTRPTPQPSDAELFDGELAELDRGVDAMLRLIDRGRLSEDERTVLAGRVADYSGRLKVIARKLESM
jgi:hypothetical protein